MPPRAHWRGHLKLSLVSCQISLYPAISAAERVSFRQVNRHTGNRLRQQLIDTVTGDVVSSHEKGRGYEIGESQLLLVPDQDLEAAQQEARRRPAPMTPNVRVAQKVEEPAQAPPAPSGRAETKRAPVKQVEEPARADPPLPPVRVENNRTIEIERFVPGVQVDPCYYDTPYYITPRDEVGLEAFAVIRDAMRDKDMAGLGRVVLSKRERPIMLSAMGMGLRGMTLRYAHEVRSPTAIFAGIPDLDLPDEMLEVAEHILAAKTADFDPAFLEDRYRTALVWILKKKQEALPTKSPVSTPSRQNVVNLMDALKRSLETELPSFAPKAKSPRNEETRKPASKRSQSQRKRKH